jgi:hypothetical protein
MLSKRASELTDSPAADILQKAEPLFPNPTRRRFLLPPPYRPRVISSSQIQRHVLFIAIRYEKSAIPVFGRPTSRVVTVAGFFPRRTRHTH